jgi:hypothetical protein
LRYQLVYKNICINTTASNRFAAHLKMEMNRRDAIQLNTFTNHTTKEAREYFASYNFVPPQYI